MRKTYLHILFSFALTIIPLIVATQTISVTSQTYNEDNGLSRYANFTHKDSRGLIWIGTQFGLYRFDGQGFVHFDEKDGLPFRQIMEIYEDSEGWFWLYTSCLGKPNCIRDLAFFHPTTKEVLTFEQRFGDRTTIQPAQIVGIGQDSTRIYFTADKKLFIWSAEKNLQEIPIQGLPFTPVLWTKINDGLLGAFYSKNLENSGFLLDKLPIQYMAFDLEGRLKQAPQPFPIKGLTFSHLNRMRKKVFQWKRARIKNWELSIIADGTLQIDTLDYTLPCCPQTPNYHHFDEQLYVGNGPTIFHPKLGAIEHLNQVYLSKSNRAQTGNNTTHINIIWIEKGAKNKTTSQFNQLFIGQTGGRQHFYDKSTNYTWVANSRGVHVYAYEFQYFQQAKNLNSEHQLPFGAFLMADKTALLNVGNTLFQYTSDTIQFISFVGLENKKNDPYAFAGNQNEATFWGLSNFHLFKIDKKNFSARSFLLPTKLNRYRALYKEGQQLWLGGTGISLYDVAGNHFSEFTQYNEFQQIQSSKIHFFYGLPTGELLIATDTGLYLFHKEKGIIARYSDTEKGAYYLPSQNFYHISPAKTGGYWLATTNGLLNWNPKELSNSENENTSSPTYQQFSSETGLVTNEILAAYEDDYGFVWASTPHGLVQFQIATGLSKTYLKADGLSHPSGQEYTHAKGADGTLYIGSYEGFNIFHPRDFKDVDLHPVSPIIITEFEQYISTQDKIANRLPQLLRTKSITLQPGDKLFNIRVALADYRNAKKHRFVYKIEGYHKEWQEDRSNLIRISGLPYGEYALKIKGQLQSSGILEIPIQVLKPFYLKFWFFTTMLSAFLLSLFLFYKWRVKTFKKQQKKLELEVTKATKTINQQNETLKNMDKVKSRFFANVSHELRTPLTLLLSPIQTVLKSNDLTVKNDSLLRLAQQNGQRLLQLTNEILDLNKLESGKLELQLSNIVLFNFLRQIIAAFQSHADSAKIELVFQYELDKYLQIKLDKKKTETVLINLLSNALKFTPSGGKVTIIAKDDQQYLQVSVQDTGRGIHPDDLPHIFNRFFQTSQSNSPAEGGTGIGLALSQELTKLMKGALQVTSEVNHGATFTLALPHIEVIGMLSDEQAVMVGDTLTPIVIGASTIAVQQQNGQPTNQTILLVEDNHDLRKYIQSLLLPHYQVATAENGQAALNYLGSNDAPNLIISDIMMPIIDGYQLLTALKASEQYQLIPVIMLTALANAEHKLKALRIGVDDYMLKPFSEEELLARVHNLIKHATLRQEFLQTEPFPVPTASDTPTTEKTLDSNGLSPTDQAWLAQLEHITLEKLGDFKLSVEQLASEMAQSRWQFNRHLKGLTGLTARQYLLETRLNQARTLLEQGNHTSVKAVVYTVGIKDLQHFSRQFKDRFGKLPSQYLMR